MFHLEKITTEYSVEMPAILRMSSAVQLINWYFVLRGVYTRNGGTKTGSNASTRHQPQREIQVQAGEGTLRGGVEVRSIQRKTQRLETRQS